MLIWSAPPQPIRNGLAAAIAITVLMANAAPQAHGQQIVAQPVLEYSWPGFGSDFAPDWQGKTKRIDFPVGGGGGSSTGGVISFIPPAPPPATPIGLLSSSRLSRAITKATVQGVVASNERDAVGKGEGPWHVNSARFSEIVNLQNVLLDQGAAVAEHFSSVTDNSINAAGRFSAAAYMDPGAAPFGSAEATAAVGVSGYYLVSDPVWFEISGSLSGVGAINLAFSLKDVLSDTVIYSLNHASGSSRAFSLAGKLEPGRYLVNVDAASSALIDGSTSNAGGMGEYSLSFTASPRQLGDVNGDSLVNGADVRSWARSFGYRPESDLNSDGVADGADFLYWQRGIFNWVSFQHAEYLPQDLNRWMRGFGQNPRGDADGDRDADGSDFLLWQRKFAGNPGVSAVPEPSAVFLTIAALSIVAFARRTR